MADGSWSATCPKCKRKFSWKGEIHQRPKCPTCHPQDAAKQRRADSGSGDTSDALEQAQDILDMIDELPERAEDFGESVGESVRNVMQTIELTGNVTDRQQKALDGWEYGVRRWFAF